MYKHCNKKAKKNDNKNKNFKINQLSDHVAEVAHISYIKKAF